MKSLNDMPERKRLTLSGALILKQVARAGRRDRHVHPPSQQDAPQGGGSAHAAIHLFRFDLDLENAPPKPGHWHLRLIGVLSFLASTKQTQNIIS